MSLANLPGLNFQLGEDIDALRDAVREFAQSEIAPRAAEIDRSDQFPMDRVSRLLGSFNFRKGAFTFGSY